jgi:hypothetical protein
MSKKRKLEENIVIICEGSETENNYFEEIKKRVIEKPKEERRWSKILIVPKPKSITTTDQNRITTKGRTKRELTTSTANAYYLKEDNEVDYGKYKAQPTRYVREAQLFMEEGVYSNAWAVFDRDQFTDFQNAYLLAQQANVGIAFSNLAFEMWVLFHFERNTKCFNKVECKSKPKGKTFNCGTVGLDCLGGELCLCGYVRSKFPEYSKKMSNLYEELSTKLNRAYINAAWSRFINKDGKEIFNKYPYTDVDKLIKLLLNDASQVLCAGVDEDITMGGKTFRFGYSKGVITVTNKSDSSLLLTEDNLKVSKEYFEDEKSLLNKNEYLEGGYAIELENKTHMPYVSYRENGCVVIVKLKEVGE